MNASDAVCSHGDHSATGHSPFIFYVVFGLLLAVVALTLVLAFVSHRRRPSYTVSAGNGPRFTAKIRLVVMSGDRQRSPVPDTGFRRSTQTTIPTVRAPVIADTPGPYATGKETR